MLTLVKSHKTFGGRTEFWVHASKYTQTEMKFSTFIPEGNIAGCLVWLSGLSCTEENFIIKAGAQKFLAEKKLMIICPDTSPRGLNLQDEHTSYDFGSGAGFYVDATVDPYTANYKMYSYVTDEIYDIVQAHFRVKNISIFGHSMGGHGALTIGLKNPDKFKSISAFSPIVNPIQSAWGKKAFLGYLGNDEKLWESYDTCALLNNGKKHPAEILIHQGTKDEFLEKQLLIEKFAKTAKACDQKFKLEMADGYDHSYYFISTFIEQHILHHAHHLKN